MFRSAIAQGLHRYVHRGGLVKSQDEFHDDSVRFVGALQDSAIPSSIGPPFTLEVAKAVEQRGAQAALRLIVTIEEYEIELTRVTACGAYRTNTPLWECWERTAR